jgi:AraC-like DNA-binding protein
VTAHDIPTAPTPDVVIEEPAIWVRRGPAPHMERSHRHDDLELNYVLRGRLDYLFGGTPLRVTAGNIAVFWAATPHRLIDATTPGESDNCWVHIPLATTFGWGLPGAQLNDLLSGEPIVVPATAAGRDVESMFVSWLADLDGGDTEQFALLEVQALVKRLLHYHSLHGTDHGEPGEALAAHPQSDGMQHVAEMAQFMVANFRSTISTTEVAESTHLNPNYAMTLFRETVGTTIGNYLTRCRVAEAQRLLLTTTLTTTDVAHAAGFGSQSSFYAHFTRVCGLSPSAYRKRLR